MRILQPTLWALVVGAMPTIGFAEIAQPTSIAGEQGVFGPASSSPSAEETQQPYFDKNEIDRLLGGAAEQPLSSEIELVQREEPVTGMTQEERTLREQVRQAQGAQGYANPYANRQTYAYGPNSLLPNAYGLMGGSTVAYDPNKRWYVSVAQTADYVTNLALPFIVTPNTVGSAVLQDDWQFQSNIFAQYRICGNKCYSLTTAFNFYQSLHPRVEQLDLTAYTSLTQYTRVISDRATAFVNYNYTYYFLDYNSLLTRNSVGSGFSVRTRPQTVWTVVGNVADNNFLLDPNQSSKSFFTQIQRLKYLNQASTLYWLAGYTGGVNTANIPAWSYDLNSFYVGAGRYFGCNNRNQLFVAGTYGNYSFRGFDLFQAPPTRRADNIYTLTTRLSRQVNAHSTIFAQYTYFDSDSNIGRQNFTSHFVSVGGILAW